MQVTAEQTNPCTIVLNIEVDEQQVTRTFDSVYREFSRYVNVPGFRPGKAPRAVVERYVNKEKVRERALEKLVTDTFKKAIEDEDITPYRQPRIEPADLEDRKPYAYTAVVPLEPQVTLGEYTGLTVEKPVYSVTDEDVEKSIQKLREGRARLERITDRGVQEGDMLIVENQVVMEGEEPTETPRRQLIQLGNNIPGFDEAVMGMTVGEERTFDLSYPDDFDEEDKRGKKATFNVKLHSISAKKMPELDDDFAQAVAPVDTLEELRNLVREREQQEMNNYFEQAAESRIILEIMRQATIHFPDALADEEIEEDLRRLGSELRQSGMTYEQYLERIGRTQEEHIEALRAQASERIRSLLALRQVAQQENIDVENADIDAEFDRLLNAGSITEDQYEEFKADSRRRLQMANVLVRQRLHEFLFANNTVVEVAAATPPDPEELAEAQAEDENE